MRLQKRKTGKAGDGSHYHQWTIGLPSFAIERLAWEEGNEIAVEARDGGLFLRKVGTTIVAEPKQVPDQAIDLAKVLRVKPAKVVVIAPVAHEDFTLKFPTLAETQVIDRKSRPPRRLKPGFELIVRRDDQVRPGRVWAKHESQTMWYAEDEAYEA